MRLSLNPNPKSYIAYRENFAQMMLRSKRHRTKLQNYPKLVEKIGDLLLGVFEARTGKLGAEFDPALLKNPILLERLQNQLIANLEHLIENLGEIINKFPDTEAADLMKIRFYVLRNNDIAISIKRKRGNSTRTVINNLIIDSSNTAKIRKNPSSTSHEEESVARLYQRWKTTQQKLNLPQK